MADRTARFLDLSARLTGWSVFDLRATGMAEAYVAAADARLPPGLLDGLLAAGGDDDAIMDDARLGPLARTLILLWYTGSWTVVPGVPATSKPPAGVISPAAYQAGLMWRAAGAHPAGAEPQGYAAWALEPEPSP
ncbi:hypothetical protein [Methylobacterium sp. SyP6R]|uniref:hypothetical protein n=1 Tax=Methylobacterium sp. SyP6R TaxID=2718876 RepID=UPI001F157C2B|nr:hypothetical protein [Methylobacterium sp. SyP6R]MCF4129505.1 hypothetical protein [Methylobacterium sp. SyP6R]